MTKNTSIPFEAQTAEQLGEINITTAVLETIAAKAASKVEGAYLMHPSFQKVSGGFFNFEREKTGAKVKRQGYDISIDLDIRVRYGYSVPEVAMAVQERVKEQILFMTDLVVTQVNVHVLSVETENNNEGHLNKADEIGEGVGE